MNSRMKEETVGRKLVLIHFLNVGSFLDLFFQALGGSISILCVQHFIK